MLLSFVGVSLVGIIEGGLIQLADATNMPLGTFMQLNHALQSMEQTQLLDVTQALELVTDLDGKRAWPITLGGVIDVTACAALAYLGRWAYERAMVARAAATP